MSTLVGNKFIKSFLYLFGFILFCLFVLPIISILTEILFKFGSIVGTSIRLCLAC